jgi:hypothetical protein
MIDPVFLFFDGLCGTPGRINALNMDMLKTIFSFCPESDIPALRVVNRVFHSCFPLEGQDKELIELGMQALSIADAAIAVRESRIYFKWDRIQMEGLDKPVCLRIGNNFIQIFFTPKAKQCLREKLFSSKPFFMVCVDSVKLNFSPTFSIKYVTKIKRTIDEMIRIQFQCIQQFEETGEFTEVATELRIAHMFRPGF